MDDLDRQLNLSKKLRYINYILTQTHAMRCKEVILNFALEPHIGKMKYLQKILIE